MPIYEHTPLTLRVKTTVFLFCIFPFLRHVRMTTVFCIFSLCQPDKLCQCLHIARLWIDLACLQRNHWLTGSSWDGRRCHRKTRTSVCESDKSTPFLFMVSAAFRFPLLVAHFAAGSPESLLLMIIFDQCLGSKLKLSKMEITPLLNYDWDALYLSFFFLYPYMLGFNGYICKQSNSS